ncbi:uncharacterized protein LOC144661203 isoform X1 [Oculina patagonica]
MSNTRWQWRVQSTLGIASYRGLVLATRQKIQTIHVRNVTVQTNKQWTNNDNLPCSDNNSKTKGDRCVRGTCVGSIYSCLPCQTHDGSGCPINSGYCVIQRTCFSHKAKNPNNPCQECDSTNNKQWTNNDNFPCSDHNPKTRGDRCVRGTCVGSIYSCLSCQTHDGSGCPINSGYCVIQGTCFSHKAKNPNNPCQECDSTNNNQWTNNNNLPCSDKNPKTRGDRCVRGTCVGSIYSCLSCQTHDGSGCPINSGYCVIQGTCFIHKAKNPNNPCQECDSINNNQWTNNNNLPCNDNNLTTKGDRCMSGACVGTPYSCLSCETHDGSGCPIKSGYCIIQQSSQRTCFAKNQYKSGNPCQICDPSSSISTWSDRDGVACDDGNKCTRGDTCRSGQCTATPFWCNSVCQYCNGHNCSLKTGFGFVKNNCTCRINGQDYAHQTVNPSNQCQWCDLLDAAARVNSEWTNRPTVPCDDHDKCTKLDMCVAGSCKGQGYSCQSSYPASSCLRTSECVGDGTCRYKMRSNGTICRPAVDNCDQPERCDGSLGTCPAAVVDTVVITTGIAEIMDRNFHSPSSYQYNTDRIFLRISGFSVSCGTVKLRWFVLPGKSACSDSSLANGTLPNGNIHQTLTGLTLQDNTSYKVAISASDLRDIVQKRVCSCVIVVDATEPTGGWIYDGPAADIDYQSSKLFQANWGGVQTRHGVGKYEWKLLLTSYKSNQTTELTPFSSTNLSKHASKIISNVTDGSKLLFVVRSYTKAGLFSDLTSDGVIVDTSPPLPAEIYDGSTAGIDLEYAKWSDTFSANWNSFHDPHSPISRYMWAIQMQGTGLSTTYTITGLNRFAKFTGLSLVSGEKYCAVVRGYNEAGLFAEAKSDCVLIDHDAPQGGTVNDGYVSDVDYQANDTTIVANWNGFTDGKKGSGIVEYKYKITSENGSTILNWTLAGNATSVTQNGLPLKNNTKYFVTVEAIDAVGLSTNVTSDGVLIDTSHPLAAEIYDGRHAGSDLKYSSWTNMFSANWEPFTDPHSPISKYTWAVQQLNAGYITSFINTGRNFSATASNISLVSKETYCAVVRGYNEADLYTEATSNCVLIDHDAPQAGTVNDGQFSDVDYQSEDTMIAANWNGFTDGNNGSGIVEYRYKITEENGATVVSWTSAGNRTEMAQTCLSLKNNTKYFVTVNAIDAVGLSTNGTSDGVLVDTSHPLAAKIYDGSQAGSDLKYSTWTNTFSANWEPFTDPHSPISKYTWAVQQLNAGYVSSFINTALKCSATARKLNLISGEKYCAVVRGYNEAGFYTEAKSDCVLIDHDAPQGGTVNDGYVSDVDYQANDTTIATNWNGFTDGKKGSGIVEYKYKITVENGSTVLNWTSAGNATNITKSDLILKSNTKYFVTVKAIDAVGLSTDVTSDGVLIDTSHPLAAEIYDGSQTGSDLKYSTWTNMFSANWKPFTDPQSRISKYTWTVQKLNKGYLFSFTSTGFNCSATARNLNLVSGEKYCAVVRGYNGAGLYTEATSDCILIDRDAPQGGTVNDGYVGDVDYQLDDTMIAVNWDGFTDGSKGSGIVEYKYKITDCSRNAIVPFTSVGKETRIIHRGLSLRVAERYYVTVKAIDAVGLSTDVASDGFISPVVIHKRSCLKAPTADSRLMQGSLLHSDNDQAFLYSKVSANKSVGRAGEV